MNKNSYFLLRKKLEDFTSEIKFPILKGFLEYNLFNVEKRMILNVKFSSVLDVSFFFLIKFSLLYN